MRLPSRRTLGLAARRVAAACALVALASLTACNLFRGGAKTSESEQVVSQAQAGEPELTEAQLQREVQRLVESYMSEVIQASGELTKAAGTPEAAIAAQRWRLGQSASALAVATGPRATSNLLDFVVLATLASFAQQDYWASTYGAAAQPLIDVHKQFEESAWRLADRVLTKDQQSNLLAALESWRDENRGMKYTAFLRIPAFTDIISGAGAASEESKNVVGSLLKIVNVDPFSGLDPATREIERSRLFAERVLFYAQRVPFILSMQVELTAMELGQLPGVQEALDATVKLSDSVNRISESVKDLPETLEAQRQGLLTDLEKSQPELQALLTDTRATLEQAHQLSESLDQLTHSVDGFVGQFRKKPESQGAPAAPAAPAPAPGEAVAAAPAEQPQGRGFDIRDYGTTARDVTETTRELNQLVTNLDQTLPEVERVLSDTEARGARIVDRAFSRGMLLIGLLLGGGLLVALVIISAVRRRPEREPRHEPTVERGG